jgi:hypothetical protein
MQRSPGRLGSLPDKHPRKMTMREIEAHMDAVSGRSPALPRNIEDVRSKIMRETLAYLRRANGSPSGTRGAEPESFSVSFASSFSLGS